MIIRTHAEWQKGLTRLSAYRAAVENGCDMRIHGKLVHPESLSERVYELERAITQYQERYAMRV